MGLLQIRIILSSARLRHGCIGASSGFNATRQRALKLRIHKFSTQGATECHSVQQNCRRTQWEGALWTNQCGSDTFECYTPEEPKQRSSERGVEGGAPNYHEKMGEGLMHKSSACGTPACSAANRAAKLTCTNAASVGTNLPGLHFMNLE